MRAFLEIRGEEYDDIEDRCTLCSCDEFKGRPHVELPLNRVVLDGKDVRVQVGDPLLAFLSHAQAS